MTSVTAQPKLLAHPWEPIYNAESRLLVLGTFPSPRSRAEGFYFGHPQNLFWQTLAQALGATPLPAEAGVAQKTAFLLEHRIALWDVVQSCSIKGAADSSIENVTPNRFAPLIAASRIEAVFTTGHTATVLFNQLAAGEAGMRAAYLPSTSPANRAAQARPEYFERWQVLGRILNGELTAAQNMQAADRYTIEQLGVPSLTLMERAAKAVVAELLGRPAANAVVAQLPAEPAANEHVGHVASAGRTAVGSPYDLSRVLCVCGTGNNGGDGLAVARLLRTHGIAAQAVLVGNPLRLTPECAQQLAWAREAGVDVEVCAKGQAEEQAKGQAKQTAEGQATGQARGQAKETAFLTHIRAATVVDALFGIGFARPLLGEARAAVQAINKAAAQGAKVVAIDMPSGVCANTGEALGVAVKAHATVAIQSAKPGHVLEPGRAHTGHLVIANIGIQSNPQSCHTPA